MKKITADSELRAQTIRAEIKILESKLTAQGKAEAEVIKVEGSAYANLKIAEQMLKVADKNAEITKIEGSAEAELQRVLGSRRLYQFMNAKLDAIRALGQNINLKIFGSSSSDSLSQIGAYGLFKNGNSQPLLQ